MRITVLTDNFLLDRLEIEEEPMLEDGFLNQCFILFLIWQLVW